MLEEVHAIERTKWDHIAARVMPEASEILPEEFAEYCACSPGLADAPVHLGDLRGKRVLEYGCGMGKAAVALARSGAQVSAFDLSPASVEVTRARLDANGVQADVIVAAGEALPYADEAFDIVVGESVLHHLDSRFGAPELHRVVAPGGRVAFGEPMGMNPALTFAREHLPYRHKAQRGADRPLTYDDIHAWGERFSQFDYREVQLLSMAERLFGYHRRLEWARHADAALLGRWPALRRFCRYVCMTMTK